MIQLITEAMTEGFPLTGKAEQLLTTSQLAFLIEGLGQHDFQALLQLMQAVVEVIATGTGRLRRQSHTKELLLFRRAQGSGELLKTRQAFPILHHQVEGQSTTGLSSQHSKPM